MPDQTEKRALPPGIEQRIGGIRLNLLEAFGEQCDGSLSVGEVVLNPVFDRRMERDARVHATGRRTEADKATARS